ncbi:MAG: hypothetical protein MJ086_02615 [Lachnospiraceae bacterium]|nr:hypothetical protein [Lachnospiraceae bacterium]
MKTNNNINKPLTIITIIILATSLLTACGSDNSSQFYSGNTESNITESTSQKVEITNCEYSLGDGVTLFWNAYPEADGYNVCRGDSNIADEVIAIIDNVEGQNSYNYKDTEFDYSKHDFYCVTAFRKNAAGEAEAIAASRVISIKSEFGEQGGGEAFDFSTARITELSGNRIAIEDANGSILEERSEIHVKIDSANAYVAKHQRLFGRPIVGVDSDGNHQLGNWELIYDGTSGDREFTMSGKYAEFGFEFDIVWGTDWPYSDVFWHQQDGVAEDIFIEFGGTARNAWIQIRVNGSTAVHDSNCSSHTRYNWDS